MVDDQLHFDERLRRLERKHRAMSRGYTTHMRSDGLIVAKPRRAQVTISGKSILLFLLAFIAFKGFLVANLGALGYEERLDRLKNGTLIEKAGAFVMQIDPLSQFTAEQIGPILR
ncbi:MAG: hypothetical protein ACI8R4_000284 [Paracoccaceae bacterium]|jgi:hypothetical protein